MKTVESEDVFLKAAIALCEEKGIDPQCNKDGTWDLPSAMKQYRNELYDLHQKILILKKLGLL